jgi:hypothetical protein
MVLFRNVIRNSCKGADKENKPPFHCLTDLLTCLPTSLSSQATGLPDILRCTLAVHKLRW